MDRATSIRAPFALAGAFSSARHNGSPVSRPSYRAAGIICDQTIASAVITARISSAPDLPRSSQDLFPKLACSRDRLRLISAAGG